MTQERADESGTEVKNSDREGPPKPPSAPFIVLEETETQRAMACPGDTAGRLRAESLRLGSCSVFATHCTNSRHTCVSLMLRVSYAHLRLGGGLLSPITSARCAAWAGGSRRVGGGAGGGLHLREEGA